LAGGFVRNSARENPDAKLKFDPLPVSPPPMPTLQRPMILPRVLGSTQQSINSSQQAVAPRIIRTSRQSSGRRTQSQASTQPNLQSQEENETPT